MHLGALIVLFFGALAVTALCRSRGWSAPLLLVAVGLAVSFVPGAPDIQLDPGLVLTVVLPPLLYSAALDSSYLQIRANVRPIGLLAVGLVLVTTIAVGVVAHAVLPGLPWAVALVLGAVVAPPDAVAAVAIGRRLGLPRRVMTLLGGESLVNDATALTAFKVAVAVAVGTGSSVRSGLMTFLLAALGGAVIGVATGWVVHEVRRRLQDSVIESALGMLVPFGVYLAAEQVGASGVLAVVVAGLYLGHNAPRDGYATRLQEDAVWKAVDVLLESLVFALIGLQLRHVLADVAATGRHPVTVLGPALIVLMVVIAARVLWVFPATYVPRWLFRSVRDREPPPSWRRVAIVSWAGMRGVVTLAAAAAIPIATNGSQPFPFRDVVILIAFVVTVGTLLVQGLSLPWMIRTLRVEGTESQSDALAEAQAQHHAANAAVNRLGEIAAAADDLGDSARHEVADRLRELAQHRSNQAWERLGRPAHEIGESPGATYRRMRRDMLAAEREVFVTERDAGRIDDEVLRRVLRELDLEEAALDRD